MFAATPARIYHVSWTVIAGCVPAELLVVLSRGLISHAHVMSLIFHRARFRPTSFSGVPNHSSDIMLIQRHS